MNGSRSNPVCIFPHAINRLIYNDMNKTLLARPDWLKQFPALARVNDRGWTAILDQARVMYLEEGEFVYREQDMCEHFLFVTSGSIRVQKSSENGGIITLYHLSPGESCELTTSCLLAGAPYSAEAIAEEASTLALLPEARFQEALIRSPNFREYVFSRISKGMNELVTLVEEVAFGQMDGRLARCLLEMSHDGNEISSTHQMLAEELGSAREVISRLLKKFERCKWVRLHRGRIEIIDREILEDMSRHIDR